MYLKAIKTCSNITCFLWARGNGSFLLVGFEYTSPMRSEESTKVGVLYSMAIQHQAALWQRKKAWQHIWFCPRPPNILKLPCLNLQKTRVLLESFNVFLRKTWQKPISWICWRFLMTGIPPTGPGGPGGPGAALPFPYGGLAGGGRGTYRKCFLNLLGFLKDVRLEYWRVFFMNQFR